MTRRVVRLVLTVLLFAGVAVGLWVTIAPHFTTTGGTAGRR